LLSNLKQILFFINIPGAFVLGQTWQKLTIAARSFSPVIVYNHMYWVRDEDVL